MRKHRAMLLAALAAASALSVSILFALRQNPAAPVAPDQSRQLDGCALFEEQGCMRCHSIAGRGSPRNPLDGVGARMGRRELREWITGNGEARQQLSPGVREAKRRYTELPVNHLDALVNYLASLDSE